VQLSPWPCANCWQLARVSSDSTLVTGANKCSSEAKGGVNLATGLLTNHAYRISHGNAFACKSFASVRIKIPQQARVSNGSMACCLDAWLVNLQLSRRHSLRYRYTHTHTYTGVAMCAVWVEVDLNWVETKIYTFHYEFLTRLIGGYVHYDAS